VLIKKQRVHNVHVARKYFEPALTGNPLPKFHKDNETVE